MNRVKINHLSDYLFLLGLVSLAVISTIYLNGNQISVKLIVLVLAIAYFLWGIIHQWHDHKLYPEIVLEYGLYAILGALPIILLT